MIILPTTTRQSYHDRHVSRTPTNRAMWPTPAQNHPQVLNHFSWVVFSPRHWVSGLATENDQGEDQICPRVHAWRELSPPAMHWGGSRNLTLRRFFLRLCPAPRFGA